MRHQKGPSNEESPADFENSHRAQHNPHGMLTFPLEFHFNSESHKRLSAKCKEKHPQKDMHGINAALEHY